MNDSKLHINYAAANILLSENGDVKVCFIMKKVIIPVCVFYDLKNEMHNSLRCGLNMHVNFYVKCQQVADFGVSAQLTRTISRRKVNIFHRG